MSPRSAVLLLAAALALGPGHAYAQATISGRVLDAEGNPFPNVEVLLHAITEASGSRVDRDTSRADGGFDLRVSNVNPQAVYFVAVTHDQQLYMGELLRPPFPEGKEYIVRVGLNPVDLTGATRVAPATRGNDNSRRAGAVVIILAGLVLGTVLFAALRRRPPENRRLLVELARLEEELSATSQPGAVMEKRRLELRKRLMHPESG